MTWIWQAFVQFYDRVCEIIRGIKTKARTILVLPWYFHPMDSLYQEETLENLPHGFTKEDSINALVVVEMTSNRGVINSFDSHPGWDLKCPMRRMRAVATKPYTGETTPAGAGGAVPAVLASML